MSMCRLWHCCASLRSRSPLNVKDQIWDNFVSALINFHLTWLSDIHVDKAMCRIHATAEAAQVKDLPWRSNIRNFFVCPKNPSNLHVHLNKSVCKRHASTAQTQCHSIRSKFILCLLFKFYTCQMTSFQTQTQMLLLFCFFQNKWYIAPNIILCQGGQVFYLWQP
jgi:hypothetical protein